jgi:hypothetical protein
LRLSIIALACLGLASCGPKEGAGGPVRPRLARVTAQPPAQSFADQTLLGQAAEIRSALLSSLLDKNCRSAGGDLPCRNLAIPCAFQESVSPSDQADGVAYRVVFATGFETQAAAAQPWEPAGEYLRVEIAPDGNWHSVGVAERIGGACSDQTEYQVVRVLTFSP